MITSKPLEIEVQKAIEKAKFKVLGSTLTKRDMVILRSLLQKQCRVSSLELARDLGMHVSTLNRRRKFIEANLIDFSAKLNVRPFGYKEVMLDIRIDDGSTNKAMSILQGFPNIIKMHRGYGSKGIDIRATAVIKESHELVRLCDSIEAIEGVSEVTFFEVTEKYNLHDVLQIVLPEATILTASDLEDVESQ